MIALIDILVMAGAYWAAFLLRFDFLAPQWGWRAVAQSFVTVWICQQAALLACGCSFRTRRYRAVDLPKYLSAAALSAGVLTLIRFFLPMLESAHIRPPYSITLLNTVFFAIGIVGVRYLWTLRAQARWREAELLALRGKRAAAKPSEAVRAFFKDKRVMVTGAGGSIGSEIVRQVAAAGAREVLMVERGENALYQINRRMEDARAAEDVRPYQRSGRMEEVARCVPLMRDINDVEKMRAIFAAEPVDIVLHAAAYKHVPMVEQNPEEGWRNNAEATRKLAELAHGSGVPRFVLISTDKAVKPVSVMGQTKRAAEKAVLALGYRAVRFGNVMGSSGSVVPLWREQIAKGGPVTVTDRRMMRYFMSVEEAVSLVLEVAAMPAGGKIYVLDMGKPISVLTLAEEMIRQEGLRPYKDIPIVFTGIRPGEKLVEELDVKGPAFTGTGNAKIFICGGEDA